MTRTIVINELARVEGHGGITVELDGNALHAVRFDVFEGPRLLEALLQGRQYQDVAATVSRICAICSTAHYVTSLQATESAFGVQVSEQTRQLRELLFRGENIESHALHVFLLAAPDYLGYTGAIAMAADHPDVVKLGLYVKQLGNLIQEVVGGRAIHPVNPVLGGFARLPTRMQLVELRNRVHTVLEQVPVIAEFMASLPAMTGCQLPTTFAALRGESYTYSQSADIVFSSEGGPRFRPAEYGAFTNEQTVPHSHAKHSRYHDEPFMVGALARLTLNAEKISARAAAVMERIGLSLPSCDPLDNNKAQVVELVMDLEWSEGILDELIENGVKPEKPAPITPRAGTGTAVVEAPRGLLVHSYTYDEHHRIARADIITPTAMNAASMERHFGAGVEQSVVNDDATLQRRLEIIARAYDPCISCSVHLVRLRE